MLEGVGQGSVGSLQTDSYKLGIGQATMCRGLAANKFLFALGALHGHPIL